jgi:hypothetical protein
VSELDLVVQDSSVVFNGASLRTQANSGRAGKVRDGDTETRAFVAYSTLAEQPSEVATIKLCTNTYHKRADLGWCARRAEERHSLEMAWTKKSTFMALFFIYRATRESTRLSRWHNPRPRAHPAERRGTREKINEHSEQTQAPLTHELRDVPRCGALSLLQKPPITLGSKSKSIERGTLLPP